MSCSCCCLQEQIAARKARLQRVAAAAAAARQETSSLAAQCQAERERLLDDIRRLGLQMKQKVPPWGAVPVACIHCLRGL